MSVTKCTGERYTIHQRALLNVLMNLLYVLINATNAKLH